MRYGVGQRCAQVIASTRAVKNVSESGADLKGCDPSKKTVGIK